LNSLHEPNLIRGNVLEISTFDAIIVGHGKIPPPDPQAPRRVQGFAMKQMCHRKTPIPWEEIPARQLKVILGGM
jgi:hypothetical protein